jgi:DNA (cytosine-5)-methyltransferase 1
VSEALSLIDSNEVEVTYVDTNICDCASAIDLFCGVGGLTHGLTLEGFSVAYGIDVEESCRYAFEKNNDATFLRKDVSALTGSELNSLFEENKIRVLVGCAPCQPFSSYNQKNNDPKWQLLEKFGNLIIETQPEIVSMENVPRLMNFRKGAVFNSFVAKLEADNYHVWHAEVYCPDYGVPQKRKRLVLLASKLGKIELIKPTHTPEEYLTVKKAIKELPAIRQGEINDTDPFHRAAGLSETNLKRIRASKPSGTWRDWDDDLVTPCHKKDTGKGYAGVYGRMAWDEPSPTITTQYYGFGNGRFGHPEQDRAITLREGAILQSFPPSYKFLKDGEKVHFTKIGRMIGNAVPVALGQAVAKSIRQHLNKHKAKVSTICEKGSTTVKS